MEFIENQQNRKAAAKELGETLYDHRWELIINSMREVDSTFAQFVEEVAYGTIYSRKNLSLPYREISAITALTQLNLKPQLKSHIIAALRLGISREEIIELFLHLTMFIGFPLCLDGLRVAKEVFNHQDNKADNAN
ncbi:MAG: carboxymuconolactone decarboxylase family protein [Candidatus Heimdallarchaeota archaeon]|nr:carboxymuconolactone decarboxylase family protein [Candidatus Heimdallarchaeota archaeon]